MKKLANYTESKPFKDLSIRSGNSVEFMKVYLVYIDTIPSTIKKLRFCQLLSDIIENNPNENDYISLIKRYKESNSTIEKVEIRHGIQLATQLSETFSNNSRVNNINRADSLFPSQLNFWIKRGCTEHEAKTKIMEFQSNCALKRHSKQNKTLYRQCNPMCIEYWIKNNHDNPAAACQDYKNKNSASYKNRYDKFGQVGIDGLKKSHLKRKNTIYTRFGGFTVSNGLNSNLGKKFNLRLYKRLRKLGFKKTDFLFASNKFNELVRTDLTTGITYFYDFCLKPLKLIIEFNGIYWHARNKEEWRRTNITYEEALLYDKNKIYFMEQLGYNIIIVWEDDDYNKKLEEIVNYVKTKMDV